MNVFKLLNSPRKKNNLTPYSRFVYQFARMRLATRFRERVYSWRTGRLPRQIIFLHIPKSAGSTIVTYIETCVGDHKTKHSTRLNHWHIDRIPGEEELETAAQSRFVSGHFSWRELERVKRDDSALLLTTIRAPLARLRSLYFYMRHHPVSRIPAGLEDVYASATELPPEQFFKNPDRRFQHMMNNFMTRTIAGNMGVPTTEDEWQNVLGQAKENIRKLDCICLSDELEQDFIQLASKIDLPLVLPLRSQNVTKHLIQGEDERKRQAEPFTDEAVKAIEPLIKFDRQIYDLAMELRANAGRQKQDA